MKIGQLAKAAATQVEAIRYYEREGLLSPGRRSESNYRLYDEVDVHRLAFIRHCRCLDMSLDEIRVLLRHKDAPRSDCAEVNAVLDGHISHVVERIRELQALEKELKALRARCAGSQTAAQCGILEGLERESRAHGHSAKTKSHLH